jgi:HTH-type transcriptional regulator/antitoxin HigA
MSYDTLNKAFPLHSILSAEDHAAAIEVITPLVALDLSDDEMNYLMALADLIECYEMRVLSSSSSISPQEALKYLLKVNGLRPSDITDIILPTHTSAILAGTRRISKTEAARLGARFKVDPMLFIDKILPIGEARHRPGSTRRTVLSESKRVSEPATTGYRSKMQSGKTAVKAGRAAAKAAKASPRTTSAKKPIPKKSPRRP